MSKNNAIKKADKKFIRLEKARIRREFLDVAKQEELINKLYERFASKAEKAVDALKAPKTETKKQEAKPKAKTPKAEKAPKAKRAAKVAA